ncbi:GNAT family N-acetyltransferase [Magnetospirillum sp. UT-4]|uniref:GNAT family N-acetyltransferase n=1 Tax=Magnetospirillum sp. UT-4 TaxID=2681467 RepID=UPI001383C376|nr:GNAT family N-acetyltransferase [Magnetospirillum sp. UT-4]CAA7623782.1 putative Acyl-CoA N-acyltransferases [Magnetospirillum sp. UT-4]
MLIRKLGFHERPLYADHLKRLPDADRRFRFAAAQVSDQWIDRYVAGIGADDLILAAFDGESMLGAVHIAIAGEIAELGVSVDPTARSRGLGADLMARAVRWARNRFVLRAYTLCQSDNTAMVALARKLGMTVHRDCGTAEAYLPLLPPDFLTVSDEVAIGLHVVMQDMAEVVRTCRGLLVPGVR